MNLIEFIENIENEKIANLFMLKNYPEIDYYDAEVYLKDSLDIKSTVFIFDGSKMEGMIEMEINDAKYYNLFSLDLLVEVCNDYKKFPDSKVDLAEKVINYRIKDA